jgi:MFS family permease
VQSTGSFAAFDGDTPTNTIPLYILATLALAIFALIQNYHARHVGEEPEEGRRQLPLFKRLSLHASPLIDLTLFRMPNFTPAILINFLTGCMLIIAMVNVPLIINVLELDAETAALSSGYLLSGMTASMALLAYAGGRATEQLGYRPVVAVGLGLCALGLGLMGFRWGTVTPHLEMAWQLIVLGMGFGLVIAPVGTAVINAAPPTQRGTAASLAIVFRLIGMSVGLSALTSWGLHRFGLLRTQINLPDLPLSDPAYQQAIVDGLIQVTVRVLTETFIVSAVVGLLALMLSFTLRRE